MSKVRNVGIPGVEPPTTECDDPRCPFHGKLPTRGRVFTGKVISDKMRRTVVIRRDYLKFVKKFDKYRYTALSELVCSNTRFATLIKSG